MEEPVTTLDLLYLALIAVILLFDHFVQWPTFLRRSQTDSGQAWLWYWSAWMMMWWTLVGAGVALWLFEARTWESLRLIVPHGWRMWLAVGLILALAVAFARPVIKMARGKRPKRVKMMGPHVERIVPRTRSQLGLWVTVSLTAGFCEEFIFRGYLLWVFQSLIGLWGAAALSVVVFALTHAYQGVKGILSTGIVGSLLALVVVIYGSLWPAIALHALLDISQGLIGWLLFRRVEDQGSMVAA